MSVNTFKARSPSPSQLSPTSTVDDLRDSNHGPSPPRQNLDKHQSLTVKAGEPQVQSPTSQDTAERGGGQHTEKQSQNRLRQTTHKDGEDDERWTVGWDGDDDRDDPLNTPKWKKQCVMSNQESGMTGLISILRVMTAVLALSCACVTCCSSMAGDTYTGMEADLGVSEEVCILSISSFVAGLGIGPRKSRYFSFGV